RDIRVVDRRIERPERRPRPRQADRPAEQPHQRPAERDETLDDGRRRGQEIIGGGEDASPLEELAGGQARPEFAREVLRAAGGDPASGAPSIAAAASLLPPASPAATGIRLSRRMARAGGGAERPPRTARLVASTALRMRLSEAGPASKPSTWSRSEAPGDGSR